MLTLAKAHPGEGGLALIEKEVPAPGPTEILLRVEAAGVCGTDMQIYKWAPRMARRMSLPRVLGHEASGVVEAVGAEVTRIKVGDAVSLESHIFCGDCHQCRTDRAHLCTATRYPGIDIDGCFARHVVVPEQIAWVHPRPLDHAVAAMFEPFGIAVHACGVDDGVGDRSTLVSGCGPIGLMAVTAARAFGAETVIAVDPIALRREAALKLGADLALDPNTDDIPARVIDATGGNGAEVAIEFSGSEVGFNNAMASLTKGGSFRLVGAPPRPIEIDLTHWLRHCPRIHNIHGRRIWRDWDLLWELYDGGAVDLSPVASHEFSIAESPRAFELILAGQALKPLLRP